MFDLWIIDARLMVPLATLAVVAGAAEFAAGFGQLVWEREALEPGGAWVAWAQLLLGAALLALTMAAVVTFTAA